MSLEIFEPNTFESHGYVLGHVPSNELEGFRSLAVQAREFYQSGRFKKAGVGKDGHLDAAIRGDSILWWESAGRSVEQDRYLQWIDAIRLEFNRRYFLGLKDFECHYAVYPVGSHYQKHVDRFRADERRALSVVAYLNEDWKPEDGGEIVLHLKDQEPLVVRPELGRVVLFLSDEILHEVRPAQRERWSVTGWMRR